MGHAVGEGFVAATAMDARCPRSRNDPDLDRGTLDARCIELARSYLPLGLLRQLDGGQLAWLGGFRDLAGATASTNRDRKGCERRPEAGPYLLAASPCT